VTSLSLELVRQLVEAAKEGDIGKLKEIVRDGFSDSYVLNNSFLKVHEAHFMSVACTGRPSSLAFLHHRSWTRLTTRTSLS
jgi:hypothetical protein